MFGIPEDTLTAKYMNDFVPDDKYHEKYSRVVPTSYGGHALIASTNLKAGDIVEKFIGPIVNYDECTEYDKRYVLLHFGDGKWKWLLPLSNSRYLNHACEPNCVLDNQFQAVVVRDVNEGEELTFIYNKGREDDEWDPIWNFDCQCGSKRCQGKIDRYRDVPEPQLPGNVVSKHSREE